MASLWVSAIFCRSCRYWCIRKVIRINRLTGSGGVTATHIICRNRISVCCYIRALASSRKVCRIWECAFWTCCIRTCYTIWSAICCIEILCIRFVTFRFSIRTASCRSVTSQAGSERFYRIKDMGIRIIDTTCCAITFWTGCKGVNSFEEIRIRRGGVGTLSPGAVLAAVTVGAGSAGNDDIKELRIRRGYIRTGICATAFSTVAGWTGRLWMYRIKERGVRGGGVCAWPTFESTIAGAVFWGILRGVNHKERGVRRDRIRTNVGITSRIIRAVAFWTGS